MGKLVAIVGNTGAGKTTLAHRLSALTGWTLALEQHQERPFQALFAQDLQRYALANQADYLLLRAEQESTLRAQPGVALVDGGLEQDFHLFTRLFHQKGYLSDLEYALCARLYHLARQAQPPPDLIVALHAPLDVIAARYQRRARPLEIARLPDMQTLQAFLDEWLAQTKLPLLRIDAGQDDFCSPDWLIIWAKNIESMLKKTPSGGTP